jgi:hypothetical protein
VRRTAFTASPRQTAFRLSPKQRADLVDALEPHELTLSLLHAIEDRLYVYWETTARQKRAPKTIAGWRKRLRRGARLARELRELLPIVHKAVEEEILKDTDAPDDLVRGWGDVQKLHRVTCPG